MRTVVRDGVGQRNSYKLCRNSDLTLVLMKIIQCGRQGECVIANDSLHGQEEKYTST